MLSGTADTFHLLPGRFCNNKGTETVKKETKLLVQSGVCSLTQTVPSIEVPCCTRTEKKYFHILIVHDKPEENAQNMWLFFSDRANCGSCILLQSRLLSTATEGTYGKAQLFPSHICVRISHQGAFQRPCSVMEYSLHVFFRCCLIKDSYSGGHLFATNAFTVTTAISRTCVPGGIQNRAGIVLFTFSEITNKVMTLKSVAGHNLSMKLSLC